MNHNKSTELIAGIAGIAIIITIILSGCIGTEKETDNKINNNTSNNTLQNTANDIKNNISITEPKDIKIKVVKFEPNNPCQGCTNLGNYAEETIKTHFPEDYKSGKITYEKVNFQDPESRGVVKKYNVVGSSLYITVIKDGKEEIVDANDMWRYVWKQDEYMKIFKNKLEEIKKKNV